MGRYSPFIYRHSRIHGQESSDFPFFPLFLDIRRLFDLGAHCPPLPSLSVLMETGAVPTFIHLVLTQELQIFITSKGVDWVTKATGQNQGGRIRQGGAAAAERGLGLPELTRKR